MDRDTVRRALAAHLEFYKELGVEGWRKDPLWSRRQTEATTVVVPAADVLATIPAAEQAGEPVQAHAGPSDDTSDMDQARALELLRVEVGPDCTRCKLHTLGRKQVVFGVGNPRADLMFAGEAPGRDEDQQGEPFVGRAGQLLTRIIEAMGMSRSDVYIANVIKCRPPENRNPEPDEVATCQPFLFRQIDIIQPKVIVALGNFAAQSLLQTRDPISRLRGRVWRCRSAHLIATFHPAFLLRSPERKRDTWEDMKIVMKLLKGEDL
jgi:uracil-DNA glycosylase